MGATKVVLTNAVVEDTNAYAMEGRFVNYESDNTATVVTVTGDNDTVLAKFSGKGPTRAAIQGSQFVKSTKSGAGTPIVSLSLESATPGAVSGARVIARNASGQVVTDAAPPANVINWTEDLDTDSAFVPATGIFTAPRDGQYLLSVQLQFAGAAASLGAKFLVGVQVNAADLAASEFYNPVAALNQRRVVQLTRLLDLSLGDDVTTVVEVSGAGANQALLGSGAACYLSIVEIT